MKIHSSSLTFVPADNKAKRKADGGKKKSSRRIKKKSAESAIPVLPAPQEAEFEQLSNDMNVQRNIPTDRRTADAINAYIQESIQLLKRQNPELVSTVDYFI